MGGGGVPAVAAPGGSAGVCPVEKSCGEPCKEEEESHDQEEGTLEGAGFKA